VIALGIGVLQGSMIGLARRPAGLWLSMSRAGPWLWVALVACRVLLMLIAHAAGADEAASAAPLLVMLGLNRMSRGVVVGRRVLAFRAAEGEPTAMTAPSPAEQ
jgi:hypothetical protein